MKIWFTADSHFGHKKIINYCDRPFMSVDEMDTVLMNNWNSLVGHNDIVYHLGDFTLSGWKVAKKYFSQLRGIIRVLGNPWHHDQKWLPSAHLFTSGSNHPVQVYPPMVVLELPQYGDGKYPKPLVLCHYPIAEWDRKHYNAWHLHGHSHGTYSAPDGGCIYDVGVDNNSFAPVSLAGIARWMSAVEQLKSMIIPEENKK
jgi:calcineurin-like phosphoesterase family protein